MAIRTVPSVVLMVLPLDVPPLRVADCFFGVIGVVGEAFLGGEILGVVTLISMKALICGVVIFRHERSNSRSSPQARLKSEGEMRASKTQPNTNTEDFT